MTAGLFLGLTWLAAAAAAGFFSLAEAVLLASDKLALLEGDGARRGEARPLLGILARPERLPHALTAGMAAASGISTAALFALAQRLTSWPWPALLAAVTAVQLPVILLVAEVIPRRGSASASAGRTLLWIARPLRWWVAAAGPLVDPLLGLGKRLGRGSGAGNPFVEEEELDWIRRVERGDRADLREERRIIRRILDFGDKGVDEILVPMEQVVAVEEQTLLGEAVRRVEESGFSRLPVFRRSPERVVGVVHVLDLMRGPWPRGRVGECCRRPFFAPLGTRVADLLRSLQDRGVMMAVVTDARGAARGIVTMEDLLEEIFGEIDDEFDLRNQPYRKIGRGEYLVDAGCELKDLPGELLPAIPADGYRTLGGYILHQLRRIPEEGERFILNDLLFKIELADQRRIYKVLLRRLGPVRPGPPRGAASRPRGISS